MAGGEGLGVRLARTLRKGNVPAEKVLWKTIRNRAVGGFKFRRQHPIGPYVVDFAGVERKLVIEIDGETHLTSRRQDETRTRFLESEGWRVQRFWNTEIYEALDAVTEASYQRCLRALGT